MPKKNLNKIIQCFILSLLLSSSIYASDDAATEAEALLVNTNTEALLKQTIDQQLVMLMQSDPRLAMYKPVLTEFYNKYLSYEDLKADLVKLYTNSFTTEELAQLNAFYESPIGKKSIQTFPQLMLEAGRLATQRVQSNLPELQRMIAEARQHSQ